jgi:GH15 family glucan-1,4-alpha-glucosidase
LTTIANFKVKQGDRVPFVLTWFESHKEPPRAVTPDHALRDTEKFWSDWTKNFRWHGEWKDAVLRSVITLKGLTYAPTGGLVAAATTSLPEEIGGVRNWDYRFCWLRDASFTLFSMMKVGYRDEAQSWRAWLLRAIAGSAQQAQIMYGVHGERSLPEIEIPWLSGYENSKPVRIGNAASTQFQLDVYGDVFYALYHAEINGLKATESEWRLQLEVIEFLESNWQKPDDGIWEVRGGRKHFTQSKVLAWVAFDRAIKIAECCMHAKPEHIERWRKIRKQIHNQVCERGYNVDKKTFTQSYGSDALDASLLTLPLFGFLPATDERMRGTIAAIERELMWNGLVLRYRPAEEHVDGLPGREGVFLPCSFWLASCLHLIGRKDEARKLFERLLGLRNDLGLFSEEYDPVDKRQLGNFPQAFTHEAMIHTAWILSGGQPD